MMVRRLGSCATLWLALACGGGSSGDGTTDATEGEGTAEGTADGTADETGEPPPVPVATVGELLVPFDTNTMDTDGPTGWSTQYGKSPEIVAVAHGRTIDVLVQDYFVAPSGHAYVLRLEPLGPDYVVTAVLEPPMLDRIMGLAVDASDDVYVASGIQEEGALTLEYPAPGEYRSGIVRLVKMGWDGAMKWDADVDLSRESYGLSSGNMPELVINPMVAATSRLAVGAGSVAMVHGINTDPDGEGIRHQKALTTHFNTLTGEVTKSNSVWVSHSFDQRLFHDGSAFIEMHLGDAYPRDIVFARVEPDSEAFPLLYIKGETGDNNTWTRLGNAALIDADPVYGYLALFATEPTPTTDGMVAGSRELGVVRVRRDFYAVGTDQHLDAAMPDTFDVQSGGAARTNRLRWLTSYHSESGGQVHAERPKLVALGGDTYVVLWERWESGGSVFAGTWGMVIDAAGSTLVPAAMLTDVHLPRGDDAFTLDGEVGWITGDAAARQLHLHVVDAQLAYRRIIVD